MVQEGKGFTSNNELIHYMIQHIYKPTDSGSHAHATFIRDYRNAINIKDKFQGIRDLFEKDRATFEQHIVNLSV